MGNVFGTMNLIISTLVESESEELGILQANYRVNKDRFVGFELVGINSKGEREVITVHDCENVNLDEFVSIG
jgi:hypothetical protein